MRFHEPTSWCDCDGCAKWRAETLTLPTDAPEAVEATHNAAEHASKAEIGIPAFLMVKQPTQAEGRHAFSFQSPVYVNYNELIAERDAAIKRAADAERNHEAAIQLYTKADEAARVREKRAADAEQANRQLRKDLEAARNTIETIKILYAKTIHDLQSGNIDKSDEITKLQTERDEERARADRLQTQIDIERDRRHGWVRGMPFEGR